MEPNPPIWVCTFQSFDPRHKVANGVQRQERHFLAFREKVGSRCAEISGSGKSSVGFCLFLVMGHLKLMGPQYQKQLNPLKKKLLITVEGTSRWLAIILPETVSFRSFAGSKACGPFWDAVHVRIFPRSLKI